MGSYSYSGKGSYSSSTPKISKEKSAMIEMINLLNKVEEARQDVIDAKDNLKNAEKRLEEAENRVTKQISKLDPETKARFRRMLGDVPGQELE